MRVRSLNDAGAMHRHARYSHGHGDADVDVDQHGDPHSDETDLALGHTCIPDSDQGAFEHPHRDANLRAIADVDAPAQQYPDSRHPLTDRHFHSDHHADPNAAQPHEDAHADLYADADPDLLLLQSDAHTDLLRIPLHADLD